MSKKPAFRLSGRLIYVATVVAILGVTGGVTMGAFLSATTVTQNANFYQGASASVNGYPTPTLALAPNAIGACTSGTLTGSTSGGTTNMVLSAWSGASNCSTNNFAEKFTFAFSATITTQTNTITVTTQVGSDVVQSNNEKVTLGTGTSGAFTQTVNVYIDYGSVGAPNGGITILDLVVE